MMKLSKKERNRRLFYASVVALPIIQFLIFYVVVNLRSFLFAFQSYDDIAGYSIVWFKNFEEIFNSLSTKEGQVLVDSARNSLVLYLFTLIIGSGGAVLF